MKKLFVIFILIVAACSVQVKANAQCSVCTRSTEQLGETPAKKINIGILYLAATPLLIAGIVGYRWWKKNSVA